MNGETWLEPCGNCGKTLPWVHHVLVPVAAFKLPACEDNPEFAPLCPECMAAAARALEARRTNSGFALTFGEVSFKSNITHLGEDDTEDGEADDGKR